MKRRILWIIIGVLFQKILLAQIGVTSSTKHIYIGEPFSLRFTISLKRNVPFQLLQGPDSIPHIEKIGERKLDSSRVGDDFIYTKEIIYTSFDSGRWVIPARSFKIGSKILLSDTIMISVLPVKLKSAGYHDVHEIIEVEKPKETEWKWIIVGLIVLMAAILLFRWVRKPSLGTIEKKATIDPYIQAIQTLDQLNIEKMSIDDYYTRLYALFRIYLSAHFNANLSDHTTDELILFIKGKLREDVFFSIVEVLRLADAVKFARYTSTSEKSIQSAVSIRSAIDQLHKRKQL